MNEIAKWAVLGCLFVIVGAATETPSAFVCGALVGVVVFDVARLAGVFA